MTQATLYSVPTVGPASPTVMAQRIDDNLDAIISCHSGSARPAYAVAGMIWEDTSVAGETRLWFYDGSQDILVAVVDTTNDRIELAPQPLVDVASAATTDIGAVKSRNIRATGTATIASFGTIRAGTTKTVYFAAALTVTYNATSLITPTGASLAVLAGDSIDLVSLGSGNWRVLRHVKSAGAQYLPIQTATGIGTLDWTIPKGTTEITINFMGVSTNNTGSVILRLGTGGSPDTTGYEGSVASVSNALLFSSGSGFFDFTSDAANLREGKIVLTLADPSTNTWTASYQLGLSDTANVRNGGGRKSLSGVLDIVRLTMSTGQFDAGKIGVICR